MVFWDIFKGLEDLQINYCFFWSFISKVLSISAWNAKNQRHFQMFLEAQNPNSLNVLNEKS